MSYRRKADTMSETGNSGSSFNFTPRVWLGIAIAVVAIIFILQNRQPADISLVMLQVSAPLWVTLSAVFLAGFATGWLVSKRRK